MFSDVAMVNSEKPSRDDIVQSLINALEPLDHLYAFWEGGAIAFNRLDEWSDMDLYIAVDDDRVEETFQAVEKALKSLSPIKQKLNVPQTGLEGVSQAFYLLENTSEYLLIDLCILKLGSPEKFLAPEIHGNNVFYINKRGKIKPPRLDKKAFIGKLNARLDRLKARFTMFNNFVQKEINRANYLEAIDLYHVFTLATLVELLRMKHHPLHYDFKMRYIHYELPLEAIKMLEHLYFVKDKKDLQQKYHQATKLINQLIQEITPKEIEKLIRTQ
jgi:hypothetical protein